MSYGGVANATTISGGGQYVGYGGVANATTISGGWQFVYNGGVALNTTQTISANVYISALGNDSATKVTGSNASGSFSYSNGVAKNFIIYSGGSQFVSHDGVASATSISCGWQLVSYGGVASDTTICSGGSQNVYDGGVANVTTISSGGSQIVYYGGVASATTISSGGSQNVYYGGVANATTISSDANQSVSYDGVASATIVSSGGSQSVFSGGVASATTISSGGSQSVFSGGVANATTIKSSGYLSIYNGGTASVKSIASGAHISLEADGTLNLAAGNTLYGDNSFSDATITGGTSNKRVKLAKNAKLSIGANMNMKKLHLNASDAAISVTGLQNTLGSLQTNKSTKISYNISKVTPKSTAYMLSLSTKNTQNLGVFSINVKKSQGVGVYELSKNIVQEKNALYTINVANRKQGTAKLNGTGLIKGTAIYTVNSGASNTIKLTVGKTGSTLKGTTKAENLTGTNNWDVFYGGKGNDTITGKNGHDVAVYDMTAWGKDVIAKTNGAMTLLFKDLKASDIVKKVSDTTMTITKKNDQKQTITVSNWNDATHNIIYASSMTEFNKFLKAATPTTAQTTAARNDVFKKASLASS